MIIDNDGYADDRCCGGNLMADIIIILLLMICSVVDSDVMIDL